MQAWRLDGASVGRLKTPSLFGEWASEGVSEWGDTCMYSLDTVINGSQLARPSECVSVDSPNASTFYAMIWGGVDYLHLNRHIEPWVSEWVSICDTNDPSCLGVVWGCYIIVVVIVTDVRQRWQSGSRSKHCNMQGKCVKSGGWLCNTLCCLCIEYID
jgi:hypothetical protein